MSLISNEFIIDSQYYDEDECSIKRIVFEIIEQNQTKSIEIYNELIDLLKTNKIELKNVICIMTDNANDMAGKENGLTTLLKTVDANLFTATCICHSLNLVISNTLKWISKTKSDNNDKQHEVIDEFGEAENDLEEDLEVLDSNLSINEFDIRKFINKISSFFHFSYKRNDDYIKFSKQFLTQKKALKLYIVNDHFLKLQNYCETRWLSMGECLKKIIPQWTCLQYYFEEQIKKKKN